jgi:large subunit ribosomal protein L9
MANTSTKKKRSGTYKRLPRGANGGIQLLLIQSVSHLGKQGDVVEVRPGYAYNYLLPQGLATVASQHHLRMIDKHKARLAEIEKSRLADLKHLAKDLERQSLTIEANANDEGHLYGSVGAPEIVAALKQNNFNITADQVRLEGQLKELGLYTVKIHLHAQVEAELKVWVVPTVTGEEEAKPAAKKEEGKAGAKKEEAKPAAKK